MACGWWLLSWTQLTNCVLPSQHMGRRSADSEMCCHTHNIIYLTFTVPGDSWPVTLVTDVVSRHRLRSAKQQLMVVPRHWLSTVGRRAFAVHGPMVWNSLPYDLRAQQDYESFRRAWKPGFSPDTSVFSALETFVIIALYKSTFTIPYHNSLSQLTNFHTAAVLGIASVLN